MLVTDMDYTLLNKEKQVSDRNKKALKLAMENGVLVVVATGRIYTSALYYAKLLGISAPIIASNGAIIREEHTDKTLYQSALPYAAMKEMIKLCKEIGVFCHFFSKDTIFAEELVNVSLNYTEWNKYLNKEDKVKVKILESFDKMTEKDINSVIKAVVIDPDDSKLLYLREGILKTGLVSVSQSLKDNLEVMNKEVSKGNAVKRIAEIYNIKSEEIITIGDNENDISMIKYAGLGVAVGNAEQCLKDVADFVACDYQEDAVARVIEKFILGT
jgi:Cof subfamily protein (haloacid dehalogenase superfamily)